MAPLNDTTTTTATTTAEGISDMTSSREVSSYDSMKHILVHLARDWGDKGSDTRKLLYTNCILPLAQQYITSTKHGSDQAASDYLSDNSESQLRGGTPNVLVPGSGLGRLAVELAAAGFRYNDIYYILVHISFMRLFINIST